MLLFEIGDSKSRFHSSRILRSINIFLIKNTAFGLFCEINSKLSSIFTILIVIFSVKPFKFKSRDDVALDGQNTNLNKVILATIQPV